MGKGEFQIFSPQKYISKYIYVLRNELQGRRQFHKSVIKDTPLAECYQFRNIPVYAYAAFPFYVMYRVLKKTAKILLRTFGLYKDTKKITS